MITVEMSHSELLLAQIFGYMRHLISRGTGTVDKQVSNQDPVEMDQDGMLGEMAFAKQFNLYPDLTIKPRRSVVDLQSHAGKTIDVKSTRHKNGRLLVHIDREPGEVGLYALAIIEGRMVTLAGYIDSRDAIRPERIIRIGESEAYGVDQKDLLPL